MFKNIVYDIQIALNQYGEPLDHQNEEARSRCLAPVSSRLSFGFLHSLAFYSLVTLILAAQPDGRPFQINHPQYSRVHHTRPYNNKRAH